MLIATANLNPSQAIVDHHCVVKPEDISRWLCEVPAKAILSTLRLKRLAASCSIVQNMSKNKKYEQEQKEISPDKTDQLHLRANAKDLFLASHYPRKCLFTRKSLSNVFFESTICWFVPQAWFVGFHCEHISRCKCVVKGMIYILGVLHMINRDILD